MIIVKVNKSENYVSFLWAPNFDKEDEPILEHSIKVCNGKASGVRREKENPAIYHGKHFFVKQDYIGFDYLAAKIRYESWKNSGIEETKNASKIGKLKYWRDVVLPKLKSIF